MQVQADIVQASLSDCECRLDSAASEALRRMGGNVRLYCRLIRLLDQVITARAGEIRAAIAQADLRAVAIAAHSLHGAALTVGAVDVAESAYGLELAADKGGLAGLAGQVDALERNGRDFTCRFSDPAWRQLPVADARAPMSGSAPVEKAEG